VDNSGKKLSVRRPTVTSASVKQRDLIDLTLLIEDEVQIRLGLTTLRRFWATARQEG
jgi:hypothetical protein